MRHFRKTQISFIQNDKMLNVVTVVNPAKNYDEQENQQKMSLNF